MTHLQVSPAAADDLLPACRLLFPAASAEACRDRLLAAPGAYGLFVARDPALRAAALGEALAGAAGVLVPPRGDAAAARAAVTAAACAWLRARGVKVCQMFVAADETADLEPPARHGFRPVTHLAFLQRDVGPALDPAAEPLRWTPWPAAPAAEQLDLLLATHEHTRDCPELNAPRTGAEIVAGFRPTATAGRMWWSCRDGSGRPVGVLLVIGESGPALEVSYLGLVPSARGQGLSHAILRFAERLAAASEYHTLTVSVDVRNAPAMRLYARHGFVEYDRRAVWLAAWPG